MKGLLLFAILVLLALMPVRAQELTVINSQTVITDPSINYGNVINDTRFASWLSVDGEWMVISSPFEYFSVEQVTQRGAIYIYRFVNSEWIMHTKLVNSTPNTSDYGKAVVINGTTLSLIASNGVYIYELIGDVWQEQYFYADDKLYFPTMAMQGDVLVVSNKASRVETFIRSAGVWAKADTLTAAVPNVENFGIAIGLSENGDALAVGSTVVDNIGGFVYLYRLEAGSWVLDNTLFDIDTLSTAFGASVSIKSDGDDMLLAVGAPSNASGVSLNSTGSVFVYRKTSGVWTEILEVLDPIQSYSVGRGQFGFDVDFIDADKILIGSLISGSSAVDLLPARFYIYDFTGQQLTEIVSPRSMDADGDGRNDHDGFGQSIDLQGTGDDLSIFVTAPSSLDFTGGKIYIFSHDPNAEELVQAGDFELPETRGLILNSWNTTRGARLVCNGTAADGVCNVRFKSGIASQVWQNVPLSGLDIAAGDALLLQADALVTQKARLTLELRVVYADGFKRVVTVGVRKTTGYKRVLSAPGLFIADRPIKKISVRAIYNGGVGVVRLDNVSLVKVDAQ